MAGEEQEQEQEEQEQEQEQEVPVLGKIPAAATSLAAATARTDAAPARADGIVRANANATPPAVL